MKQTAYIIFIMLLVSLVYKYSYPYDSTDDKAKGKRSGFTLRTDYATGCQYLESGFLFGKALVPRYDSDGEQVCNQ